MGNQQIPVRRILEAILQFEKLWIASYIYLSLKIYNTFNAVIFKFDSVSEPTPILPEEVI